VKILCVGDANMEALSLNIHTFTHYREFGESKGRYTFVTLPRNVTPYRDSVDGTCDHVTYQKLVTRLRYGLVRCAVGIWPSLQRDGTVTA